MATEPVAHWKQWLQQLDCRVASCECTFVWIWTSTCTAKAILEANRNAADMAPTTGACNCPQCKCTCTCRHPGPGYRFRSSLTGVGGLGLGLGLWHVRGLGLGLVLRVVGRSLIAGRWFGFNERNWQLGGLFYAGWLVRNMAGKTKTGGISFVIHCTQHATPFPTRQPRCGAWCLVLLERACRQVARTLTPNVHTKSTLHFEKQKQQQPHMPQSESV
jgi:hypothetical protein